jgi:hypothetical protein
MSWDEIIYPFYIKVYLLRMDSTNFTHIGRTYETTWCKRAMIRLKPARGCQN